MILLVLAIALNVAQPLSDYQPIQTAPQEARYRPLCGVRGHILNLSSGAYGIPNHRTLRWELYNGGNTPVRTGDVPIRREYRQAIPFSVRISGHIPDHTSCRAGIIQPGAHH